MTTIPGTVACPTCYKPMLPESPHRHETEPQPGYDPMPPKPQTREGLVAAIAKEYAAEIPPRLHVRQVPSQAEPIGVSQWSAEAAGYVPGTEIIEVLDTGELGSPPWSPPFHRYIGSWRFWEGVSVRADDGLPPWTRNLEGIRRWCAGKHQSWYEHRGQPLCWTLVCAVVLGGYSVGQAAKLSEVSVEKADELLFGHPDDCDHAGRCPPGALDKWWTWVWNDLNGLTMKRIRKPAA